MNIRRAIINVDGGARGNPGPAAFGVVIKDEQGRLIASIAQCIGRGTNNQAEYHGIIAGLKKAISLGAEQVNVLSDSELAVKQLNGQYRVKNVLLKPLFIEAQRLRSLLNEVSFHHIPREQNKEADALVNKALDSAPR